MPADEKLLVHRSERDRPSILHVIGTLGLGGAERVLASLVDSTATEFSHTIVVWKSVEPAVTLSSRPKLLILTGGGLFETVRSAALLLRSCVRGDFSVIQGWLYIGALIASLLGLISKQTRVVWSLHNTGAEFRRFGRISQWAFRLLRLLSKVASPIIVYCSESAYRRHLSEGFRGSVSTVIFNGVDVGRYPYRPVTECQRAQVSLTEPIRIICVARWNSQKGHIVLFKALRILLDRGLQPLLTLVGPGVVTSNRDLARCLEALDIEANVCLLGPRDDISELLAQNSVFVLPSLSEAFPVSLCEAMLVGLPCVATRVGDVPLILDGLGFLAEPNNVASLVAALEQCIGQDPEATQRQVRQARHRIEKRFSLSEMKAQYVRCWRES